MSLEDRLNKILEQKNKSSKDSTEDQSVSIYTSRKALRNSKDEIIQEYEQMAQKKASKEIQSLQSSGALPENLSKRQEKKTRREERSKTKGLNWFDMKAPEMTEELKNNLTILQYRRALDPKRFYKAPDLKTLPKFFQTGKVIESPAEFYSSRVPIKQRKATLVDELLADAEFRKYNKKKYEEIQKVNMKKRRSATKRSKHLKKKKR
ncbi:DgyrCDS6232 [Dimorphilus gyrociliatus]|uniref:DgyrCDS6232 n=1 Tax=Dimorphilus gyrociliatus TaxID=2664684 RepID=A0A7I8VMF4_9ANNE|nr:DgyrCDS6232 [Dimorphilus gyrociliatus]